VTMTVSKFGRTGVTLKSDLFYLGLKYRKHSKYCQLIF